jgi:tRNA(adenine34) deaminase
MTLWSTLSPPWQACIEQAWEAYCAGCVPIGACITDSAGRIATGGRNRLNEHGDARPAISGSRLAHAEVNALLALDERLVDPHTCTLYTTMEPCPLCVGALTMANIRCFHYAARDGWAGAADLVQLHGYIKGKKIVAVGPERADLENVLVALHVVYHRQRVGERERMVLDVWESVTPVGARLGLRLFDEGALPRMAELGWTAAQVVDDLCRR